MQQVILIHGAPTKEEYFDPKNPSPSNAHWFPWIQKEVSLMLNICEAPEFPEPYNATYEAWVSVFEQYTLDRDTTLVGHSCGGGFLLRYLSEHPGLVVDRVILVAPWLDPEGDFTTSFFDFTINPMITEKNDIHIFMSSDDHPDVLKSFAMIRERLPNATYHQYADQGHFTEKTFPDLLELL